MHLARRSGWQGPTLDTFGTIDLFTHQAVVVADTGAAAATVILFTEHLVVLANTPVGPVTSRCAPQARGVVWTRVVVPGRTRRGRLVPPIFFWRAGHEKRRAENGVASVRASC